MSIVVTFQTDGGAIDTYTLTADQRQSLNAYRLTLLSGGSPLYPTDQAMLKAVMINGAIVPAMTAFTPTGQTLVWISASVALAAFEAYAASYAGIPITVRHNLFPVNSANFSFGGFSAINATFASSPSTAPDSTNSAILLTDDNTATAQHCFEMVGAPGSGTFVISSYFKAGAGSFVYIQSNVDSTTYRCWFNLGTGAIGTNTFPGSTAVITPVAGAAGWYRCSVAYTGSFTSFNPIFGLAPSDAVYSYTGTSSLSVYQWGQQLDANALTAYEPVAIILP